MKLSKADTNIIFALISILIFFWSIAIALFLYDPSKQESNPFIYKSIYKPTGSWNIEQHKRMGLIE